MDFPNTDDLIIKGKKNRACFLTQSLGRIMITNFLPKTRHNSFLRYFSVVLILLLVFYGWFSMSELLTQGTRWGDSRLQKLFNRAKNSEENTQQYQSFCNQPTDNITKKFDILGESGIGNALIEYISIHKEAYCNPENENSKFLVYEARSGTGNRMQSLVSVFLLAVLTKRAVLFEWEPDNFHSCEFKDLFVPPFLWSSSFVMKKLDFSSLPQFSSEFVFIEAPTSLTACGEIGEAYDDNKFVFIDSDEYFMPVLLYNPHYRNLFLTNNSRISEDKLFHILSNFLFVPNELITNKIEQGSDALWGEDGCDVGVHMREKSIFVIQDDEKELFPRCAQYAAWSDNLESVIVKDYEKWLSLNNTLQPKSKTIHVATDHIALFELFQKIPNSKVTSLMNYEKSISNTTTQTQDMCVQGAQLAVTEMFMLQKCRRLVLTSWSSFGYIVSGMSGTPPLVVDEIINIDDNDSIGTESTQMTVNDADGSLHRNGCFLRRSSEPCYYEYTHLRLFSCFDPTIFYNSSCCLSGFCGSKCLHHDSQWHPYLFLVSWNAEKAIRWSFFGWIWYLLVIGIANKIISGFSSKSWKSIILYGLIINLLISCMFLFVSTNAGMYQFKFKF